MNGVMVNFLDGEGVFGKFDGDGREVTRSARDWS